jgi:uncharacterized protein (TIGR03437 family)
VTGNATQTSLRGNSDGFVARFDPDGQLVFSSYLGGSNKDSANSVAIDPAGNTASEDFVTTAGAYQKELRANCPYPSSTVVTGIIGTFTFFEMDDGFVTKLDAAGNLVFSTYLGADCYDVPGAVAVDANGNMWLAGTTNSNPFPQVNPFAVGPAWSRYKAFVSELDASGSTLKLSSYLDVGSSPSLAVDRFGNAYVAGPGASDTVLVAKIPPPAAPAALSIDGVANAFSHRSGRVAPGEIIMVTADGLAPANAIDLGFSPAAPLPRELAETQVLFDGEPAAIISVKPGAVVCIAPYGLAGKPQTAVQVIFRGTASTAFVAPVGIELGLLSADGSGRGQAFARLRDGSLNSADNPAPAQSTVTFCFTGSGVLEPSCPEGGVAVDAKPVDGVLAPFAISSVTTVPGGVCGLYQVQATAVTASGTFQIWVVASGGVQSNVLTYVVKR